MIPLGNGVSIVQGTREFCKDFLEGLAFIGVSNRETLLLMDSMEYWDIMIIAKFEWL